MKSFIPVLAALASLTEAQRPANTSICDYYTTALLKENTAANQLTLLTLVVNTAVIGNYTQPNVGIAVAGILAPGTYNNTKVNLGGYFDGSLKSSNRGGSSGVSINFLDDGGAAPLKDNKPSNGNSSSNQYLLLTHLYGYFGTLLGCTMIGKDGYPAYTGQLSMYQVHKFMDLNPYQVGYFITQVGTAAASFGVATADIQVVATALQSAFGARCAPAVSIPATAPANLQSICIDDSCPLAANATCPAYSPVTAPMFVNGTVYMAPGSKASGSNSTSANGTSTSGNGTMPSPSVSTSSGAGALQGAIGLAVGVVFAVLLA